ncbi:MAG: outer membrane protein assembly factor BamD [Crocinitomicaceae bacterium]
MIRSISNRAFYFLLLGLPFFGAFTSCSDYNKVVKGFNNYEQKYEMAYSMYKEEKYIQALTLFEQILPKYKLTPKGEDIYYHYAYCHWKLKDYYLSGFYFKQFVKQYPNSKFAEECAFLAAMSSVKVSPEYSLDQTDTYAALDEIQLFIDEYPFSPRIDTCNKIMDRLRGKLELKLYNYAKLYYKMENYKASYTALQAALQQYPNTAYREEMLYMMLNSAHKLSENSVAYKKLERYEETIKVYHKFAARYPESKYSKNAERIFEDTKFQIELMKIYQKVVKVENQTDLSRKRKEFEELKPVVEKFLESITNLKVKNGLSEKMRYIEKDLIKEEAKAGKRSDISKEEKKVKEEKIKK